MVKNFSLDGINVLGGLDWVLLPADIPHKKALADFHANHKGVRHGVVLQFKGEGAVGRLPTGDVPKGLKTKKVPSAAALLAMANARQMEQLGEDGQSTTATDNGWILVQKIESAHKEDAELYWMGAVRNGLPQPGGDFVGTLSQVTERVEELLNISPYVLYTTDRDIRYNFLSMTTVVEKRFGEFVVGLPTNKAEIKLFSFAGLLLGGIVVAFILLVGGWWGVSTWQEKVAHEKAVREQRLRQQQEQKRAMEEADKYEKDVRAAVLAGLDQGMGEINAGLASTAPQATVNAWRDLIYNIDVYQSTWKIESVTCGLEGQTPICTISLKRGELGNNRQLLLEHSDATITGDEASYVVRGAELQPREVTYSQVSSSLDFGNGLLSDLQNLRQAGITHDVEASKDITKDVTLPPPPSILPQAAAGAVNEVANNPPEKITINLGFASGAVNIKGDGLWQMAGIAKYLDQPNMRVTDFSVKISPENLEVMTWELKAAYFVRNQQQPTIPPVLLGERKINVEVPEKYRTTMELTGGVSESSVQATQVEGPATDASTANPGPSFEQPPTN